MVTEEMFNINHGIKKCFFHFPVLILVHHMILFSVFVKQVFAKHCIIIFNIISQKIFMMQQLMPMILFFSSMSKHICHVNHLMLLDF